MEALEDPESSPSLTGGLTYLPTVAGLALPSALYVNTISNMYYTYMPPPHPSQPLVCLFTQPTPTFCAAHTRRHNSCILALLMRLPQLNLTCLTYRNISISTDVFIWAFPQMSLFLRWDSLDGTIYFPTHDPDQVFQKTNTFWSVLNFGNGFPLPQINIRAGGSVDSIQVFYGGKPGGHHGGLVGLKK